MSDAPKPSVLITRPNPAGQALAAEFGAVIGVGQVVLSPVMQIRFVPDPIDLTDITRLIFTSQNGVESFVRCSTRRDIPCLTVGHKTAAVAAAAGLNARSLGPDVASLIADLRQSPPPGACLYVRGAHVRTDLCAALSASGLSIREHIGYVQDRLGLTPMARALLLREAPVVIPLYSARATRILFANNLITAPLYICAISEFVVANLPPVRKLVIAPRPDAEAMRACTLRLLEDIKY